jgi:hypothetical protein
MAEGRVGNAKRERRERKREKERADRKKRKGSRKFFLTIPS